MRYLVYLSRILVGSLFIVSGLIKANDPLGFSYKLEEYFAESALNWPMLEPYALALAILVCFGEIILGFALLFGGKMKLSTITLTLLCLFFLWLTFYTANCDPSGTYSVIENGETIERPVTCVTDCGCFGDAMKGSIGRSLTPWESFTKDLLALIALIPSLLWILIGSKDYYRLNDKRADIVILIGSLICVSIWSWVFTWWFPVIFTIIGWALYFLLKRLFNQNKSIDWIVAGMVSIISILFINFCYNHLPLRDYRPYAEGKSISEQMKSAEELGLESPIYATEYTFTNTNSNLDTTVLSTDWIKIYKEPWFAKYEAKSYDGPTLKIKDGYEPTITDFGLESFENGDLTMEILSDLNLTFLFISYNVGQADKKSIKHFSELASLIEKDGHNIYGASSSGYEEIESFRHDNQLAFEFLIGDEKMLKTVVRANPGLVILSNGMVLKKYHGNDLPSYEDLKSEEFYP